MRSKVSSISCKTARLRFLKGVLYFLLSMLASCGGGGDSVYISPCFPFPESWCTPVPGDTTPPSAPLNLFVLATSPSSISLSWDGSVDDVRVIGYRIYRDGVHISHVNDLTTNTTDTALEALTTYCYTVTATDSSGNESSASNQSCTTTQQDTTSPSIPGNLTVTYVEDSSGTPTINLAWSASQDDGIIGGYEIYRDGAYLASTSNTTYADSNINPLTNYCYAVLAYDKSGNRSGLGDTECVTSSWQLSSITTGGIPSFVTGSFHSVDVGGNNAPSVCFVSSQQYWDAAQNQWVKDNKLTYAYNATGNWAFQDLDSYMTNDLSDLSTFSYPSIRVGTDDAAHIAYIHYDSFELYYLTNASGIWEKEIAVDNQYITGSDMVLDTDNHAHIGFIGSGDFWYVTNRNGSWEIDLVEDILNLAYFPSITIDQSNHIHASYYEFTGQGGALKYATNASGAWVVTTIATAQDGLDFYPSITTDPSGNVHIIYFDKGSRSLKHAGNATGTWLTSVINNNVDAEEQSDVDVDSFGNLHVSYVDTLNQVLMYSSNMSGAWESFPVDSASWVEYPASIATGADGTIHIIYRGNTDLLYATTQ